MSDQRPFTPASFQQYLAEKKLMASCCQDCGTIYLPPRTICPKTHGTNMAWVELSGRGKLAAFTVIYVGLTAMVEAGYDRSRPYCTAVVELQEGVRISALLLDVDTAAPSSIQIGMPLEMAFLIRGEGEKQQTMLAFRPAPVG